MKTTLIIIFLLFLFPTAVKPQVTEKWVTTYAGAPLTFMAIDDQGNVYATGTSDTTGSFLTIKFDSLGRTQWISKYADQGLIYGVPQAIAVDNEGNVFVTGFRAFLGKGFLTIKYNSEGVQQWAQIYNGPVNIDDQAKFIAIDNNGNIFVSGSSYGQNSSLGLDIVTIKYNPAGVEQWVQRYNGPNSFNDYVRGMVVDNDGSVYVTGVSDDEEFWAGRIRTIKYNSSGIQQWIKTYAAENSNSESVNAIGLDISGNVFVVGQSLGAAGLDYVTIKYSPTGVEQWVQRYNVSQNQLVYNIAKATSLVVDSEGSVYVTGTSSDSLGLSYEIATVKYNSTGVQQWVKRAGNIHQYAPYPSITIDDSVNVYIGGFSSASELQNWRVIKYNSDGVLQWEIVETDRFSNLKADKRYHLYTIGASGTIIQYLQETLPSHPPTLLTYNQYIHTLHWKNPKRKPNKLIIAKKMRFTPEAQWEVIGVDSTGVLPVTDSSWTIRTSGYNEYKVGAVFGSGDTMYSNSVIVPRGYYLRKIEGDSVSAYNIFAHSFRKITNSSAVIWPNEYWDQFDYSNPNLYDQKYFSNSAPELFPNWLIAAEVEGFGSTFINYPDKVNPGAVAGWKYRSRIHKGSCLGLSIASIFDFYREPAFYDKFRFFESLLPADVLASDSVIHMITYLQSYQIFGKYNNFTATSNDPTPTKAVHDLEQYFQNYNNKFHAYLSIGEAEMCHAIVPYAIERVNDDLYYIYVYDSNRPALNDLRIEVQMNTNTWKHSYYTLNKFITGKISVKTGIGNILLSNTGGQKSENLKKAKALNTMQVTMGSDASSFVIQNGDTIAGFNATDSTVINSSLATILETDGVLRAPALYNLPTGDYEVIIKDYGGDKAGASMLISSGRGSSLGIQRNDIPSSNDRDVVMIGDNTLSFANHDASSKKLKFHQFSENTNVKYFEVNNVNISSSDSVRISTMQDDNISLVNYGGASTFNVLISYGDLIGENTFKNTGVAFPTNSALTIVTNMNDVDNPTLTIKIDHGINGTIDDSLTLPNQYDPLPATLTSFTGEYISNGIRLQWNTAAEINNYGFEIEKSRIQSTGIRSQNKAEVWDKIGFVEGRGTTNAPGDYSFIENSPTAGTYSYRLKQIDRDGKFEYSPEVEVTVGSVPKIFALEQNYPNPFNPSTTIGFTLQVSGMTTLKVYDAIGREVAILANENLESGVVHTRVFDASHLSRQNAGELAAGVYFARLVSGKSQKVSKMLLVK
ncbi:MAG: T9SS type A sorting domain-containing protein [Bacteroidota bacterium]